MRKRTRNKRSREKRRSGQGAGASKKNRSQGTDWKQVSDRVDVSYDVLGHPQAARRPLAREGTHYEVLAYTDWADRFIPTVIKWNHGAVDYLTNKNVSRQHRDKANKVYYSRAAIEELEKAAKDEKEKFGEPGPMTLKDIKYYKEELTKALEKPVITGPVECGWCGYDVDLETGVCSHCGTVNESMTRELSRAIDEGRYRLEPLAKVYGEQHYGVFDTKENRFVDMLIPRLKDSYPDKNHAQNIIDLLNQGKTPNREMLEYGEQSRIKQYIGEVWSNKDDGVYSVTVAARSLEEATRKGRRRLEEKYPEHGEDYTFYEEQGLPRSIKPTASIQTSAGEAFFVKTEHENETGRWNDDYWTRDGYYVIHRGKQHHVYKVNPTKNRGSVK